VRWKPFRITELWAKLAYILVGWLLIPAAVIGGLYRLGVPDPVTFALNLALSLLVIAIGVRAFRAQGEAVDPPRVWWRATGRPRAGFVIGGLFLWNAILLLLPLPSVDRSLSWWLVLALPCAVFYLHSSIRLVRGDAPVPPRPRKDDDLKLIDRRRRF
jgi:amino acid transporter